MSRVVAGPPTTPSISASRRSLVDKLLCGAIAPPPVAAPGRRPPDAPVPLSDEQLSCWFLTALTPEQPVYHECYTVRLPAVLDRRALDRALAEILRRHEIWRTRFDVVDGEPRQVVDPPGPFPLDVAPLQGVQTIDRLAEAGRLASRHASAPFDLARGPMVRGLLVSVTDIDHRLYLTMHHAVVDGVTFYDVFLRELSQLYTSFSGGAGSALPEPSAQYRDYAWWQSHAAREPLFAEQLEYWRSQLAGDLPRLELDADRIAPAQPTGRGGRVQTVLPADIWTRVNDVGREEGATPFMVLLALFAVLLHKHSGQNELVIGAPVSARRPAEYDALLGMFANPVALRLDLSGNPSFRTLLARVRANVLDAVDHADVPFQRVLDEVRPDRVAGRGPLFQAMCTLQRAPGPEVGALGFGVVPLEADTATTKLDVVLLFDEREERGADGRRQVVLGATLQYDADQFEHRTMQRMLRRLEILLTQVLEDRTRRLSALSVMTDEERQRITVEWNRTAVAYPRDRGVHQLVRDQARRTPAATAVASGGASLTYAELVRRGETVARVLRRHGVEPGARVVMLLPRSIEFVVGALAVLDCGAAYVPVDPDAPRDRIAFLLSDVRPCVVLVGGDAALANMPGTDAAVIRLADVALEDGDQVSRPAAARTGGGAIACVLYTSGSTGEPKGALIPHRAIARLVASNTYAPLQPGDRVAHAAHVSFDAATFEIWGALVAGATLVVLPIDVVVSPRRLAEAIARERLTSIFLTTALFNEVAREAPAAFRQMRDVLFGGEVADAAAVRCVIEAGPPARLLNMYGPTESTTFASYHPIPSGEPPCATLPIGRPIANTTMYVLDRHGSPQAVGIAGELFIGGDGIAHGYLNRPNLTADRFLPDRFSQDDEARLYRTGDRARYRDDGVLEFLGRIDDQVKIRGYRIEPGEIETILRRHPAVADAIVVAPRGDDRTRRLRAFVLPRAQQQSTDLPKRLRAFVKQKLPEYMVPALIDLVDEWPRTSSGKVDRRALRPAAPAAEPAGEAPASLLEAELVQIWEELLAVGPIGRNDSFFDLGGHSLLVARMIDRVEGLCGRRVPIAALFADSTIASLARAIVQQDEERALDPVVVLQPRGTETPLFFVHGDYSGRGLYCRHLKPAIGPERPLYVVQPHGVDGRPVPFSIRAMAEERVHAIQTIRPEGPYVLGGYCHGALIAFEAARILAARGARVDLLVLIAPPPLERTLGWLECALDAGVRYGAITPARGQDWFLRARDLADLGWIDRLGAAVRKIRRVLRRGRAAAPRACRPAADLIVSVSQERTTPWAGYWRAIRAYVPHRYDGRIALMLPEDDDHAVATLERWRSVAPRAERCAIPGSHSTCITTHVHAMAAGVAELLRQRH